MFYVFSPHRLLAAGGEPTATVDETLGGSAATLVYDGSGMASVREFTASDLVEDSLYSFKVRILVYVSHHTLSSVLESLEIFGTSCKQ